MKISGIIVFCFGVGFILYPLFVSYNIFTGNIQPPNIFKSFALEADQVNSQEFQEPINSQEDFTKLIENSVESQLRSVLPSGIILHFLNIAAWSILSWIFIVGGFHLASLGIKLMR